MGKKKVTRQDKIHNTAMEEKLESLKALNSMLLKETFERRQQVESLQLSNGSLQSQLTDQSAMLDLHTNLVSLYVSVQMTEFMDKEKDQMKAQLEVTQALERKMVQTDHRLLEIQNEVFKLNAQIKVLVEENDQKQTKIEVMTRERNVELGNKNELEKRVTALNELLINMRNQEKKLRENVAVLEKRFVESVELQNQNAMLVEEMKGEVKLLESSVAEARKKKNFWLLVSSSAAIVAAAIAYARF